MRLTPGRARVVGAFRRLQPFAQHVTDLGYTVAGATADPDAAVAELLTGWVMRVIDQAERKIGLSIKGANRAKEMADAQGYASPNAGGATLGDKFRGKLDKLKPKDAQ